MNKNNKQEKSGNIMLMIIWVVTLFILTIIGLIFFQKHPTKVFACTLLALFSSSAISTHDLVTSFSNQGVLTLVLLMICSLALEKTRILRYIAKSVIKPNYETSWIKLFSITALFSSVLNNTAIVSTLLAPIRNNPYHAPSKLLLPLCYAATLGGMLTLVGTSTNLVVNSLVINSGLPAIDFFDFTLTGLAVTLTCGMVLYFSRHALPANLANKEDMSTYLIDSEVQPTSAMIGKSIEKNGLRHLESLFLVEIVREQRVISPVTPTEVIKNGDRLIFSGDITKVMQLQQFDGLALFAKDNGLPIDNLTEVLIRPESVLVGHTLKESGFRALFNAAVVAIKRDGERLSGKLGNIEIQAGDFLVLAVGDDFQVRKNIHKNFIILSGVEPENKLNGYKEWLVACGFFLAIIGSAFNIIPLFNSLFLFLGLLILTGCLTQAEIIRRLPIDIWLIVSSALCLSQALTNSGAMNIFDAVLKNYASTLPPIIALIVIYLLTWLFTELVTNNAAAALMLPIGIATALSLHANPMAFIMVVAFAASSSFLSPYGYQTNLMVFSAGQYRIKDFIRQGGLLCITYAIVSIVSIVFIFGL
ncbi:SLC13 family permease [Vibrio metschnikovii]|uniref:SLC13 family permease n=1 Tax=Vibrio metschnikovii TaxID=28172 RepID=UPI0039F21590